MRDIFLLELCTSRTRPCLNALIDKGPPIDQSTTEILVWTGRERPRLLVPLDRMYGFIFLASGLVILFRLDQQIPGKLAFKRTLAPQYVTIARLSTNSLKQV